jgi:formamidopyrimidine-DNA glycosylase
MPELPEVETIRRELRTRVINRRILGCKIFRSDIIGHPGPRRFCASVKNEMVLDVTRRAKYLVLNLTTDKRLIFHLRLSGAIAVKDPGGHAGRFTRLQLMLDGCDLLFEEPRALGRAYVLEGKEEPPALKGFFQLSREPICTDFDFRYLREILRNRKTRVKTLLLDQSACAGIGNIYSDEALFQAGIRPTRKAHSLTIEETFKLLMALKKVLRLGIKHFGTTVSDYRRTDGETGAFQKLLRVYSREGEPCKICGTRIALRKIGSRNSRYCPKCQK